MGSRTIPSLAVSAAAFTAAYFLTGMVFFGFGLAQSEHRDHLFENAAMAAWLTAFQALSNAIAFAIVTTLSRRWRQQPLRRVATIAAVLGNVACLLNWIGLWTFGIGAIGNVAGTRAGVWLGQMLAGVATGALALLWVRVRATGAGE